MVVRGLSVAGSSVCGFYAFSVLPMAQVYAILFGTPLLITLLSVPVLGEKVGLAARLAVVVGMCGVLVVLRPGGRPVAGSSGGTDGGCAGGDHIGHHPPHRASGAHVGHVAVCPCGQLSADGLG
jgi:drug/metabolite transporter (DMT)-like permease